MCVCMREEEQAGMGYKSGVISECEAVLPVQVIRIDG